MPAFARTYRHRLFRRGDADREPARACASIWPRATRRRWRFRRRRARANTGRARASPNGWWSGLPKTCPRWSASTTAFPFRCAISRCTAFSPTGRASSTISSAIGRPTRINIYVDFVRDGIAGNGAARTGNARWRRLTEERAGGAKSVFHFDVQGSVAKSTHAGIPWLRFIRQRLGPRVHFWPFDGWDIPAGRSAIAEVYPALWSRGFAQRGPHRRPARRLQHRRLAFARRPRRQPCGLPQARPFAARAGGGAGGGLDIGRSWLDPHARLKREALDPLAFD